ncbi:MAG: sigma 54-interacting transcriptional regulator [Deltaproteobacteria bacterium]|nr:sigma 54-interacting transcriptional regulator [Deltaproteobacteria bacterium]
MKHHPDLTQWVSRRDLLEPLTTLAALIPDAAVIITDATRRVLFWSAEAERLFGYTADDVLGLPCPDGLLCDGEGLRPYGVTVRVTRADGATVRVRQYARMMHHDDQPDGAIHVLALDTTTTTLGSAELLMAGATEFHGLVTRDPTMLQVFQIIRNVAETEATVLVRGESGTGKELVARAIHLESRRRDGPFIAVNCAAFTPSLLESELFGHAKGAFTGAVTARRGIFAQADGGTLFLDEVAELPLELQAKLLRVLQERVLVPVGANEPVEVDVRVVAATHRALREEVRAGRFREDLMFRLRVVPIFLSPLRQRPLDIELLLRRSLDEHNRRGPRGVTAFSPEAMKALLDHSWPGNVRELLNVVEYAFAVGRGPVIGLHELPPEFREARTPTTGRRGAPTNEDDERERVRVALDRCNGDLDRAAASLKVSRTTFWRLRKRLGL